MAGVAEGRVVDPARVEEAGVAARGGIRARRRREAFRDVLLDEGGLGRRAEVRAVALALNATGLAGGGAGEERGGAASTPVPVSGAPASTGGVPASTTVAVPQVTVSVVVLEAAGQVAPVGSAPSPTARVRVTVPGVAGQVKLVVAWFGVLSVPPPLAVHAYVSAAAFGPTALEVKETTPPVVVVAGFAAAEVQVAQFTGVPLTLTPPASSALPVVVQARNTFTLVVDCAVTVKGADVPAHETVPSADVAVSVMV